MKKLILIFCVAVLGVGFSMGQAAPLPEQTVDFGVLADAAASHTLKPYYNKDLTVTGFSFLSIMPTASRVMGNTLDGKDFKKTVRSVGGGPLGITSSPDAVVMLIPVEFINSHHVPETVGSPIPGAANVVLAHVQLVNQTEHALFLSQDYPALIPLDNFEFVDSSAKQASLVSSDSAMGDKSASATAQ